MKELNIMSLPIVDDNSRGIEYAKQISKSDYYHERGKTCTEVWRIVVLFNKQHELLGIARKLVTTHYGYGG